MNVRPKLFRDPAHDIISFNLDEPVDRGLFELLSAPEMQRLRRIRQLGMSFLVYPGAEHSRFCHSLGVCHLARRMYAQLFPRCEDESRRFVATASALLHDLGHGAFSHVMERITGVHHERITRDAILDPRGNIKPILDSFGADFATRVVDCLEKRGPGTLSAIVSSQLDADRMDYLLRDRLATGVKIGTYDAERIICMLEFDPDYVMVNERAMEAVEGYLLARFHMYKQVYLHKATRSAERMLAAAVARAQEVIGEAALEQGDEPLDHLLAGRALRTEQHLAIDDCDLWAALKRWSRHPDSVLAQLSRGLVDRRLYKTIELDPHDPRDAPAIVEDARQAVEKAGGHRRYHLLVDTGADSPYVPYQPGLKTAPILIRRRSGSAVPIERVSAVVRLLGESSHETLRICVAPEFRDAVAKVAGKSGAPSLL
jgi:hypothetical protein